MRSPAHERLRSHTLQLHKAFESRIDLSTIATREGYIRYLWANRPCASIESALAKAGIHRLLTDWNQRERWSALAGDLAALGVRPSPFAAFEIEPDDGTLLGCAYVLEGSRLGARVILQAIERGGDAQVRNATRFVRHGDGVDFWRSFKSALSRIDDNAAAIVKSSAAAAAAFECFLRSDNFPANTTQIAD